MPTNTLQNYNEDKDGKTPSLTSESAIWCSYWTRTLLDGYGIWGSLSMFVKGVKGLLSLFVSKRSQLNWSDQ